MKVDHGVWWWRRVAAMELGQRSMSELLADVAGHSYLEAMLGGQARFIGDQIKCSK
jgi:hypothetical protein